VRALPPPPRAVTAALDLLIGRCAFWFAVAALGVALLVVWAQVFARYVLNDSLVWAEELTRFALAWSTMVGAAAAYRLGEHIGVTMVIERLRGRWRALVIRAVHLLVFAFALLLAWEGWLFALRNFARGQLTAAMQVPIAWAHLAVPVGAALIAIAAAEALWRGTPPTKGS
jgi:TRAP-type C4-dicarboxylate transport system permease small subunit